MNSSCSIDQIRAGLATMSTALIDHADELRGRQAIKVSITRPFQVWIRRRIGTFIL